MREVYATIVKEAVAPEENSILTTFDPGSRPLVITRVHWDTYLMITNVIVTFVDAFTIGTVL